MPEARSGGPNAGRKGQRFGRIVLTKKLKRMHGHTYWEAVCDCGNKTRTTVRNLSQSKDPKCAKCNLVETAEQRRKWGYGSYSGRFPPK